MIPLCKTAVPLFMMIAGVNLLSKQESLNELYRKRVLRYIIVIILFGTLHFLRYVRGGHITFTIDNWINAIYSDPAIEPYWFLYLYLGFLLTLPFFRKMASYMEKKDFVYLFTLICVCRFLAIIGYFSGITINGYVFSIVGSSAFFYPLIGYGIDKYSEHSDFKKYGLLLLLSMTIMILIAIAHRHLYPEDTTAFTNVMQVLTPLLTTGIFGVAKNVCYPRNETLSKVIMTISGTTFGIYLTEDIIRNQVEKLLIKSQLLNYINDFLVAVIFTLSVFVIGVCIIFLVKKMPIINKFL